MISFLDDITAYYHSIEGFSYYFISRFGEVYSRYTRKILKPKVKSSSTKYLEVTLCKNGHKFSKYIHRLVLETFVGPCPEGMEACHNNGDSMDNSLENLRWDTRSNNHKDCYKHGNHIGNSKLNYLQVRIIKYLLKFGKLTQEEIGKIFSVSDASISNIKLNKTWNF